MGKYVPPATRAGKHLARAPPSSRALRPSSKPCRGAATARRAARHGRRAGRRDGRGFRLMGCSTVVVNSVPDLSGAFWFFSHCSYVLPANRRKKRRGWDSNPRDGSTPSTRFPVALLRPTRTPLRTPRVYQIAGASGSLTVESCPRREDE